VAIEFFKGDEKLTRQKIAQPFFARDRRERAAPREACVKNMQIKQIVPNRKNFSLTAG
jgi:hypothetical protein